MRVTKERIISGIADYFESNIIPAMSDDRGMQIVLYAALTAIKNNTKLIDTLLENSMVKTLIDDNGSGTYDIDALFSYLKSATDKFGFFPVHIKPIPFISPTEKTLKFTSEDLEIIKKKIVGGMDV